MCHLVRDAATDRRHVYQRKGVPLRFRLRVLDHNQPQSDLAYLLVVDGQSYRGRTDANGMIEVEIPPAATRGYLTLGEGEQTETLTVALGGLDPADDARGVRERLRNLGYECGTGDPDQMRPALTAFQLDHDLPATGELEQATADALQQAHGT